MLKEGIDMGEREDEGEQERGAAEDVEADSNNNNTNCKEKSYSLRPRTLPKRDDEAFENYDAWKPRGRAGTKKAGRLKQKPQPLSKYRRKTANARERSRMREINEAFEALRRIIPHLGLPGENHSEKLTKISTLRSAMKYISALRRVLQEPFDHDSDAESFLSDYPLTCDRDQSLTPPSFSDHSLTADFADDILVPSSFDDSVSSLATGFASTPVGSPNYEVTSCFSTSDFADPATAARSIAQQLLDSNLTTFVDSCYVFDSPAFGTQFS